MLSTINHILGLTRLCQSSIIASSPASCCFHESSSFHEPDLPELLKFWNQPSFLNFKILIMLKYLHFHKIKLNLEIQIIKSNFIKTFSLDDLHINLTPKFAIQFAWNQYIKTLHSPQNKRMFYFWFSTISLSIQELNQ